MTIRPAPTIHFFTPTFRPVGGVVKVFDYLVHALDLGYRTELHCPTALADEEPLLSIPRFTELRRDPRVTFLQGLSVGVRPHDWVLFSWPTHYDAIARGMTLDVAHERVIHLVQNTRHANPTFAGGFALRLLGRPMARIMVAHQVMDACGPHLNHESLSTTIVEGHDWPYFHRQREGPMQRKPRIAYTTWKSDVGIVVQEQLGSRFAFRSIRKTASWADVRELLHWCDIFLCCPGPEEGFYLPGLEAMAAGALVVTPDVGGNRAYCSFGHNCIRVGFERADDYAHVVDQLAQWPSERLQSFRSRGYETLQRHTLSRERTAFGRFLVRLASRSDPSRNGAGHHG